jgi:Zn-dependent metalloprotease
LDTATPRLHYYYDQTTSKWKLVFVVEDVSIGSTGKSKREAHLPLKMDYVVDATTGAVIAETPRTPSATMTVSATDGLGKVRQIRIQQNGNKRLLKDDQLNVATFDFKNLDPEVDEARLPGRAITDPPQWPPSAVSAHANASAVAEFLKVTLQRNNIDNMGGAMISSINCVVARQSPDGKQWLNAFWNGNQMVYGQRISSNTVLSMSVNLDVVGHEMFHGITDHTARLEYAKQSGALNESYSDIFGMIISNFANPDVHTWDWELAEGLSANGAPFRDFSNPPRFGQPDQMKNFKKLPNTEDGDWGGVHLNSGIHNKAAYLILTATDSSGNFVLTPKEVAAIFYLAVTQQLSRTSQFSDSRRGVISSAQTLFRNLPAAEQTAKLSAITKAFDRVGIQ